MYSNTVIPPFRKPVPALKSSTTFVIASQAAFVIACLMVARQMEAFPPFKAGFPFSTGPAVRDYLAFSSAVIAYYAFPLVTGTSWLGLARRVRRYFENALGASSLISSVIGFQTSLTVAIASFSATFAVSEAGLPYVSFFPQVAFAMFILAVILSEKTGYSGFHGTRIRNRLLEAEWLSKREEWTTDLTKKEYLERKKSGA